MADETQRLIGLLGGMSWESTADYYRLANELVRDRLGGLHSARLVLASVDFADVEPLQVDGRWDEAAELRAGEAVRLVVAGAELLLLCTNTMHKVADQAQAAVSIPLLHLADAAAAAVRAAGLLTVGLLGTAFTMEQLFYRDRLASHGLQVLVPGAEHRAAVNRVICDELCRGTFREEARECYREVIARLVERGAQGIILGCTEIERLVTSDESRFRCLRLRAFISRRPCTPHSTGVPTLAKHDFATEAVAETPRCLRAAGHAANLANSRIQQTTREHRRHAQAHRIHARLTRRRHRLT